MKEQWRNSKIKKFNIKPMSAEEAILQMELVEHNFFVFKDADTDNVNVIYKRKDGNYGFIRTRLYLMIISKEVLLTSLLIFI